MRNKSQMTGTLCNPSSINTRTYSWLDDPCADFTNIDRIVISSASFGVWVDVRRIFPCLGKATVVEENISLFELYKGKTI